MQEIHQLVYIGLELVIACLAVVGNILVCWAVCLNSNLQSITNYFVVSLAVADIAVGLLAIPFAITISIGLCTSFYGCLFITCFVLVVTQSSIFSLLAIAVDRYIAIENPLRYNSLMTGQRAGGIIALCWLLSAGIGLTPVLGWNQGWNSSSNSCSEAAQRQLRRKAAHTPAPGELTSSSKSSYSTLQKELHAAKSLAIIVGLFALCWLPVHIINCVNHLCQDCKRPHIWVLNIAIILSHANSVLNPIIYAYCIQEFRQTFRKILHQHLLGRRDRHRFGVGSGNGRGVGSSSNMDTSSRTPSCVTVVNSYILEPSPKETPPKDTHDTYCQWTSKLDTVPSSYIPNEHQIQDSTPSGTQQQQCIMECAAQDGAESVTYLRGTT
uniref:adenosine A2a receptor b isoform X2 n=1 Tax=Monopterus albus TaxID=43700 RepID=UPI0009B33303|nr:adenosine receptor A2b-like isoform X2 [Monopterus albus]